MGGILSGEEIRKQVHQRRLIIEPFQEECIGPNSYDVHLKDQLFVYNNKGLKTLSLGEIGGSYRTERYIDPLDPPSLQRVSKVEELDGWLLRPGKLYLGCTEEYTETPHLVPMIDGRSSIGRLGVSVHITAGRGDVGFKGNWTLEIEVVQPVLLRPGMRIGQLWYLTIEGDYKPYQGRYNGSRDTVASRFGGGSVE